MKQIIIKVSAIFTALTLFCLSYFAAPFNVSAKAEESKLTSAVYAMTGTLYYYDTPTGKIVLNDVKPVTASGNKDDSKPAEAAAAMTYIELPTADGGRFFKDGSHAAPEWINNYVDRQIWFIAAVAADGSITVPYFKIIV